MTQLYKGKWPTRRIIFVNSRGKIRDPDGKMELEPMAVAVYDVESGVTSDGTPVRGIVPGNKIGPYLMSKTPVDETVKPYIFQALSK